jgi:phosphate butyryltransferase
MALEKLSDLENIISKQKSKKKLVLCAAGDEHSIGAAIEAHQKNYVSTILVGDRNKINQIAEELKLDLEGIEIIHELSLEDTVKTSVKLIHDGHADILMKGYLSTALMLKGVLNKDWGLRNKPLLSHFAIFDIPEYHKLLAITDVAMNIAPDLQGKIGIINNAVDFFQKLNVPKPKIAALAAVEMVNEKMQATLDAALLSIMERRGQIRNCIIDGPLAFDNAISFESKEHKGITGPVAGDADILLVPNIEAGNVLYKSFVFFANAKVASVVVGASAPIVLTSRADNEDTKLNSIMLAAASFDL